MHLHVADARRTLTVGVFVRFFRQTGQRECGAGSCRGNGVCDPFSAGTGEGAGCHAAEIGGSTPAERSVLQCSGFTFHIVQ